MLKLIQIDLHHDGEGANNFVHFLSHKRGVTNVSLVDRGTMMQLSLEYDTDLLTLGSFLRLAEQYGANITDDLRFLVLPFDGLASADSAATVEKDLDAQEGVLDSVVNYAAGLLFIGFDVTKTSISKLLSVAESYGMRVLDSHAIEEELEHDDHHHHEEGHDEHDHEHEAHEHDEHSHAGHVHEHHHDEHEGHSHEGHDHDEHGHDHGDHHHHHAEPPKFLPLWAKQNWAFVQIGLAIGFAVAGTISDSMHAPAYVSWILYLIAYYFSGYEVARHAIPALFKLQFDTDVLMILAAIGAAAMNKWAEGATLLILFSIGHAAEDYTLDRVRRAVNALGQLMPEVANVKSGTHYAEVPVKDLKIGDEVMIKPGERVPVDGTIILGETSIDQSSITGESAPVFKKIGDPVYTGTINHDAMVLVRVESIAGDTKIGRMMHLVAEAQGQKSRMQRWSSSVTRVFVPLALVVTLLVMVVPPIFGWLTWAESFYKALVVLVAASPCALAIGTPAAVLAAIGQAARNGVLIKGGIYLEELGTLEAVAFDKTGTLTSGKFSVTEVALLNGISEQQLVELLAGVEAFSDHPLAQAIVEYAKSKAIAPVAVSECALVPGRGLRAVIDGNEVLVGSLALFKESTGYDTTQAEALTYTLERSGNTTVVVGAMGTIYGVVALADTPRPEARGMVSALYKMGIRHILMLTGDNPRVANRVGTALGITEIYAEMLPEEKLQVVEAVDQRYQGLAMVGDGVNDAPALATPSIGIAMGAIGTNVALEVADVALMNDDLSKLPFAIGLSRAARKVVVQNLWISLGAIVILIAANFFIDIPLGWAVSLHEGSTVLVALNALRLLNYSHIAE